MPQMQDPNFSRSVVLLVEHDSESSFGLADDALLELKTFAVSSNNVGAVGFRSLKATRDRGAMPILESLHAANNAINSLGCLHSGTAVVVMAPTPDTTHPPR